MKNLFWLLVAAFGVALGWAGIEKMSKPDQRVESSASSSLSLSHHVKWKRWELPITDSLQPHSAEAREAWLDLVDAVVEAQQDGSLTVDDHLPKVDAAKKNFLRTLRRDALRQPHAAIHNFDEAVEKAHKLHVQELELDDDVQRMELSLM